jgi:hypothetical protein
MGVRSLLVNPAGRRSEPSPPAVGVPGRYMSGGGGGKTEVGEHGEIVESHEPGEEE